MKRSSKNSACIYLLTILFSANIVFSNSIVAAENASTSGEQAADQQNQDQQVQQTLEPSISWPVDLTLLAQQNSQLEALWSQTESGNHLSFKYLAQAKKFRGTALLLPAQGENSAHPRLIKPLAMQLSQLGFNVVVPNIAIADYPIELQDKTANSQINTEPDAQVNNGATAANDAEAESQTNSTTNPTTNSTEDETNQTTEKPADKKLPPFFASNEAYQLYFTQLLNKLVEELKTPNENLIVIANQSSAFWLLDSQLANNQVDQLIFIDPQIPNSIDVDLKDTFSKQQLPVLSFLPFKRSHSKFEQAFQRNFWQTSKVRTDKTLFDINQIEIENSYISRKIAGWVSRLQQAN